MHKDVYKKKTKQNKTKQKRQSIKTVCWFFYYIILYFYKYYCNCNVYYDFANQNPLV